jgi:hypothetical protein
VRSVGDESLLLFERALESGEQVVDGGREVAELIARIRHVESCRQILCGDALCLAVH